MLNDIAQKVLFRSVALHGISTSGCWRSTGFTGATRSGGASHNQNGSQISAPSPVMANIARQPNRSISKVPSSAPIAGPAFWPAM